MKRDHSRYSTTDGWGYALVNRREIEKLKKGEVAEKYDSITNFERSCHACHQLVKDTDFVFTRPMFNKTLGLNPSIQGMNSLIEKFHNPSVPSQETALAIFNKSGIEYKYLDNLKILEMKLFEGSLPELRATLTNFSSKFNQTYLVFDPATKLYALSIPENSVKNCKTSQKYYTGCLDGNIPERNRVEVNRIVTICDGRELTY